MTIPRKIDRSVFLDASYLIALANPKDNHHESAEDIAEQLLTNKTRIVTTVGVVLEIGNALSKIKYRSIATAIISDLTADASVSIVPISADLFARAFSLFESRADKDWGLTDCCSFLVMQDQQIRQALTADLHFVQAGYEALLLTTAS